METKQTTVTVDGKELEFGSCELCKSAHPFCDKCCKLCSEDCNLKQRCDKPITATEKPIENGENNMEFCIRSDKGIEVVEKPHQLVMERLLDAADPSIKPLMRAYRRKISELAELQLDEGGSGTLKVIKDLKAILDILKDIEKDEAASLQSGMNLN